MIVVKVMGGLGNQMFQLAFAIAHARNSKIVKLDVSYFNQNSARGQDQGLELYVLFKVPFEKATVRDLFHFVRRTKKGGGDFFQLKDNRYYVVDKEISEYNYYKNIYDMDNCYFVGYWQNIMYLKRLRTQLLQTFKFKVFDREDTLNYIVQKKITATNSVSLHIRRGDYLKAPHLYPLPEEYYRQALSTINQLIKDPTFFIFSDDIEWAKLHLHEKDVVFIDFNTGSDSWKDMYLMSKCSHNIIANSTFSWWGAWLNQNPRKVVIAPKKWLNIEIKVPFLPKNWILK